MKGLSKLLSRLRDEGKLGGTISAAKKRHADRRYIDHSPAIMCRKRKVEIPLSYDLSRQAHTIARSELPRVRKWLVPQPSTQRDGIVCSRDQEGYYSGGKNYPFYANRIKVTSYGYAFGSRLYARINTETYKHEAPRGYIFGTDDLGIYITAKRVCKEAHRLHLQTHHVVKYTKLYIRKQWLAHHERRLETERQLALHDREERKINRLIYSQDFYVTAEDSRSAGNCMAGTLAWGRRHGLTEGVKYPAKVITRLIGTHPSVRHVLEAAARRTLSVPSGSTENQNPSVFHKVSQ